MSDPQVSIEGDNLVIIIPLIKPPKPSGSGKTLVVATTSGNKKFPDCQVSGKPITLGVNAYIAKD